VGDIPLPMQVKLLRLLETGTYRRVGSTELRHADIRVVSATHRDLERLVADGRFREDLYYRLCTFPIQLPSLRERSGDVALLAPALLQRVAAPRRLQLSPAALAVLEAQDYPGNVRELRNLLERTALLCDGERIEAEHVRDAIATGRRPALRPAAPTGLRPITDGPGGAPDERPADLKALERAALREMVERHTGSRSELAERLGISERSLYRKLKTLT
jgi:DNA-binding NtrC family response regulator